MVLLDGQMLDDIGRISRIDKSGMLDISLRMDEMATETVKLAKEIKFPKNYARSKNITVLGMGGSSIGGELLRDWLRDRIEIPIETCSDYKLPAHLGKNSLIFAISYSGETEETLNAFIEAYKRKCKIFAITSGGHLGAFCKKLNVPFLIIPKGFVPRAALPYLFFPMVVFIEKMGLVEGVGIEMNETIKILKKNRRENKVKRPFPKNIAKKIAFQVYGRIPTIYSFRHYSSVAHRWKTQFNENSKVPSKYEVFPELNHNEVVGWEAPRKMAKIFSIILLRDSEESLVIQKRIEITKKIALRTVDKVLEVKAKGKSRLAKMFSLLHIGDLASVYLAILQGTDPSPTETINKIKKELEKELRIIEEVEMEIKNIPEET